MFCNACGTELQPTFNLCPKCGKPVGTMANPGSSAALNRLQKHLPRLAILWIAVGILFLIPSLVILLVGSAARFVVDDNVVGRTLGPVVMSALGGSLFRSRARNPIAVPSAVRHRAGYLYTLGIVGRWWRSGIPATGGYCAECSLALWPMRYWRRIRPFRTMAAPTILHITAPRRILRSVPACFDKGFFSAAVGCRR